MLNLYELKKNKDNKIDITKDLGNKTKKYFPSPIREWNNNIYSFNKNSLSLIPAISLIVNNFLKSYFYSYNKNLEKKLRTERLLLRLRRLSSNRFYVTNGKFNHTNNKVIINIYVYNRQKNNYISTLTKWFKNKYLDYAIIRNEDKINKFNINKKKLVKRNIIEKFNIIKNDSLKAIKSVNVNKYFLIKALNTIGNKKYNKGNFKSLSSYIENYYRILINNYLSKIRIYYYYKQLLFINKSKLNYTYLQFLKKYLEKIYSKNVEFNIINLKRFYLNSDILSQSMALKLSRNRKKLNKYMRDLHDKINVKEKKIFLGYIIPKSQIHKTNLTSDVNKLKKSILNEVKYKHVTGFRLEAKGRLSKRFTASRSLQKFKYKGGIVNFDSSFRGISAILLKGYQKSNTQHTRLGSKSRIGSFGIKGWISGN